MAIKLILDCTQGVAQYFKINGVSVNYNYWEVNEFTIEEDSVLTFQAYKGTTMVINGEDVPVYNVIERTIDASNLKEITIVMGEGSSIYTDVVLNITNVKPPITDLTGYKWIGNQTLDLSFVSEEIRYNVNFKWNDDSGVKDGSEIYFTAIAIGNLKTFNLDVSGALYSNKAGWQYEYPLGATLRFTGGVDATNTNLISWLKANGTLIPPIKQLRLFLESIANAIRKKKGTTAPIDAQDFASEIESIESGGSGLVGYTPDADNMDATFVWGILEDGTYTTTLDANNKYIYCYVSASFGDIGDTINCTKVWGGTGTAMCKTTGDNWYITTGGGGA